MRTTQIFSGKKYIWGSDILRRDEKHSSTYLSKNDKKVLDRYTKTHTNFIESSTARNRLHSNEKYKAKS